MDRPEPAGSRAVDNGYKDKAGMATDADLSPVREDPRFQALLKKLG